MKIRRCFVSNSSSMSSIVFPKDDNILIDKEDPVFKQEFLYLDVNNEEYNRGRNEILTSIEDKLRFFISMYAYTYNPRGWICSQEELDNRLDNYFKKMDELHALIKKFSKKYKVQLCVFTPSVEVFRESEWNNETKIFEYTGCKNYRINIGTENTIYSSVAKLSNKNIEKFIFDKRSFAIVGGDEYYECYDNEFKMKQTIDYEYERIADYTNHEAGEKYGKGEDDVWRRAYHWGERIPDYYDNDHIPEYDENEDFFNGGQPNLPFTDKYEEI